MCPRQMRFLKVFMDGTQKRRRAFWVLLCLVLVAMLGVQAALVDLDALVTYSIYGNDGVTPLANGSLVYIIGSFDAIVDPMYAFGSPPTNLVANSVTGDDVILGSVRIGDNVSSNGTFFTTVKFESTQVRYVYIRYFEYTNAEYVTGMVYWGQSSNWFIGGPTLGVSTVDFDPNGNQHLVASNYNNFGVIPEPSTANLLVLVAGMAWAMRVSMKRRVKQAREGGPEGGNI